MFCVSITYAMPKEYEDFLDKKIGLWASSSIYKEYSKASSDIFVENFSVPINWESEFNENSKNLLHFMNRFLYSWIVPNIYSYSKELNLLIERRVGYYSSSSEDFVYLTVHKYKNGIMYDISNIYHMGNDGLARNRRFLSLNFEENWEISQRFIDNGKVLIFKPADSYEDIRGSFWNIGNRTYNKVSNKFKQDEMIQANVFKMLYIYNIPIPKQKQLSQYTELFERYNRASENYSDYTKLQRIEKFSKIIKKLSGTWIYQINSTGAKYKFSTVDSFAFHSVSLYSDTIDPDTNLFPGIFKEFDSDFSDIPKTALKKIQPIQHMYFSSNDTVTLRRIYEYQVVLNDRLYLKNTQQEFVFNLVDDFNEVEIIFQRTGFFQKMKWEFDETMDIIKEYIYDFDKWVLYAVIKRDIKQNNNITNGNSGR